MLAGGQAKRYSLDEAQKEQINATWTHKKRGLPLIGGDSLVTSAETHINDIQQAAQEFKEMLILVLECDVSNTIHAAKIQRIGEHTSPWPRLSTAISKLRSPKPKDKRMITHKKGINNSSRAVGGPRGKPLMGVFRDSDTPDGGKAGQMTSDPAEIDAVVKGAWRAVYDGMQG